MTDTITDTAPVSADVSDAAPVAASGPVVQRNNLPPSVRAAAERADSLQMSLVQQEPEAAPPAPVASAPEQAAPVPLHVSEGDGASDTFEQRYRVLQGKYDAEVPRLSREARELRQRLADMELLMAAAAPLPEQTFQNAPTAPTSGTDDSISEDERTDYGDDLLDVISRQARAAVRPLFADIEARLRKIEGVSAKVVERTVEDARERVFSTLDREVDSWRAQNADAGFLDWLKQSDPFSGQMRQDLLSRAFAANDAPRVVAFFNAYREEHGTAQPSAASAQPAPVTAPTHVVGPPARPGLETFAAPGQGNSPTAAPSGNARHWTQADIRRFFNDKVKGVYRGRESEASALEADIHTAAREGRIRP